MEAQISGLMGGETLSWWNGMPSTGVTLHNVAAFLPHPQERRDVFSRLPLAVRSAANPGCQEKCLQAAGVEIRCNAGPGGGM